MTTEEAKSIVKEEPHLAMAIVAFASDAAWAWSMGDAEARDEALDMLYDLCHK